MNFVIKVEWDLKALHLETFTHCIMRGLAVAYSEDYLQRSTPGSERENRSVEKATQKLLLAEIAPKRLGILLASTRPGPVGSISFIRTSR